ncbi:hypothetical protein [Pseudomonas sp. SDO5591_S426]
MKPKVLLLSFPLFLSGCIPFTDGTLGEEGYVWCNNRYLAPNGAPFTMDVTGTVAVQGYMYGLAAALVLQQDNSEGDAHHFTKPPRLVQLDAAPRKASGFEASTFRLKPVTPDVKEEIIIAFAGSNDWADWFTNINPLPNRTQYNQAVAYVLEMTARPDVAGKRLVVTGISLGGALAVHVTKNPATSALISETWAINSSPRTYADSERDKRIWSVASDKEALTWSRKPGFHPYAGWGLIKGDPDHSAQDFNLIDSNLFYAHYRWGIARQMLFVADYKLSKRGSVNEWTEPLAILHNSKFKSCEPPYKLPPKEAIQPSSPTPPDYSGYEPLIAPQ